MRRSTPRGVRPLLGDHFPAVALPKRQPRPVEVAQDRNQMLPRNGDDIPEVRWPQPFSTCHLIFYLIACLSDRPCIRKEVVVQIHQVPFTLQQF